MGLIRTAIYSGVTWGVLTLFMIEPMIALSVSIFLGILIESTQHSAEVNELMKQGRSLRHQLSSSNSRIAQLQAALQKTSRDLNSAVLEINRRDAIGSPATRALLDRQEEALLAQKKALNSHGLKNEEMLVRLSTLVEQQHLQNNKMQESLTDLIEKLANKPSQSVNLTDSIMVQEMPQESPPFADSRINKTTNYAENNYLDDLLAVG